MKTAKTTAHSIPSTSSSSSVSQQCGGGGIPFTVSHTLVPLDEQRVGFTVYVLLQGHAWLLQVGQGASRLTQLLLQRLQIGINLPHLPLQTRQTQETTSVKSRRWCGGRRWEENGFTRAVEDLCRAPCWAWGSAGKAWTEPLWAERPCCGWPAEEPRCFSPGPRSAPWSAHEPISKDQSVCANVINMYKKSRNDDHFVVLTNGQDKHCTKQSVSTKQLYWDSWRS